MLFLVIKEGEYLTIGEDIVIQAFPDSRSRVRVGIKAPKDMLVLRGEVRERGGAKRPEGLAGPDRSAGELSEQQERQSYRFHLADELVEIE